MKERVLSDIKDKFQWKEAGVSLLQTKEEKDIR